MKPFIIAFALSALLIPVTLFADSTPIHYAHRINPSKISISVVRREIGPVQMTLKHSTAIDLPITEIGDEIRSYRQPITIWEGTLKSRRSFGRTRQIVSGASYVKDGKKRLIVPFGAGRMKRTTSRNYHLEVEIDTAERPVSAKLRRLRKVSSVQCPLNAPSQPALSYNAGDPPRTALDTTVFIGISIDMDSRFYALIKDDSAAVAALTMSRVNTLYQNTFGYQFLLAGATIYTTKTSDPFRSSPDANTVLDTFRQYRLANPVQGADLYHLFTAQRGFTDVIGLAYIGVACANTTYAAGMDDYASGFLTFVQTVAHEIGHNLNANHDNNDTKSIMSGSGNPNVKNPYFSQFSIGEIGSFVTASGSCLADTAATPLPTPSFTTYRTKNEAKKKVLITSNLGTCGSSACVSGRLTSNTGKPLSGRAIELYSYPPSKLLKIGFTNSTGRFLIKFSKKKGGYFVSDRMSHRSGYLLRIQ